MKYRMTVTIDTRLFRAISQYITDDTGIEEVNIADVEAEIDNMLSERLKELRK